MTTVNPGTGSDIPSNCTTLERVVAWGCLALERCNPSRKIVESPSGDPVRVIEVTFFKADDGSYRMGVRLSLPVDANYASMTNKFWERITELDTTALPAAYKTN